METAVEKMRDYAGWPTGSKEHLQLRDFEVTFYECVKDHVKAEHQGMTSSSDRLEEAFWIGGFEMLLFDFSAGGDQGLTLMNLATDNTNSALINFLKSTCKFLGSAMSSRSDSGCARHLLSHQQRRLGVFPLPPHWN